MRLAGQVFIAIAVGAFGGQQIYFADFITRLIPQLPTWVPGQWFLAIFSGIELLSIALAIVRRRPVRLTVIISGAIVLLLFLALRLPPLILHFRDGLLWTTAGKTLALAGVAFILADTLPGRQALGWLLPFGPYFFAAFLMLGGIQHFLYAQFVAALVPSWMPGHHFWTYFTGTALIAGGIGIVVPATTRLTALLVGVMILTWIFLLHIPRVVANIHDANETTALFEALAFSGAALLLADRRGSR